MIFGVGTDIVQVSRIRADLERYGDRFAMRVLTVTEYDEYQRNHMAAPFVAKRFAAKEATVKALGLGFREPVDVRADEIGRQQVGGELDTVEVPFDRLRQRLDRRGFGQARHALHQEMTIAQQADEHAVDEALLADDA